MYSKRNNKGKKYVLVLDENFTFRHFLAKRLEVCGYQCVEAWDYKWAESYIRKNTFDIIIADYRTFMNGKIVSSANGSHPQNVTPIIFLIGHATEKAMETAKRLGVKGIYQKRGDLDELVEKLGTLLSYKT